MNPGEIDNVFIELDTKLRKFKEAHGVELMERVKQRTPVDTGHLQNSWGFQMKSTSYEVYNTKDYAAYVEYGTEKMAPRGMLRTTLLEVDQITEVAKRKVGLS